MARFRHILVHLYLDIDRSRVYEILQNELEHIESIKRILRNSCKA